MKREFLEGLKIEGLTKEVVDQIMAEHGKEVQAEQAKTTAKDAELSTANTTVKDLQGKIKEFDGVDVKKLQADAVALQVKYDTDIKAGKAAEDNLRKEFALKDTLRAAGVTDPDYLIFKHGGVEKFTFDKDGKTLGLEETIAPYKESLAHLFAKPETKYNPSGGAGSAITNPWEKETFNLTKQGEIFKENPAQAKELMSAAGIA